MNMLCGPSSLGSAVVIGIRDNITVNYFYFKSRVTHRQLFKFPSDTKSMVRWL